MKPVAIFRHSHDETAGTLEPALGRQGLDYEYIELYAQLPTRFEPSDWSALVVLGGSMNVDQTAKHPFLIAEMRWIAQAVGQQLPVLGICLGSQLLAAALGARVGRNPVREIGWYPLALTPAARGDRLFAAVPRTATPFQWHGDAFELPTGAVELAQGTSCPHQAYRVGNWAWGVQFHPEVTAATIDRWLAEPGGQRELADSPYIKEADIRRELPARLAAMQCWSGALFDRFAAICRRAP